MLQKVRLPAFYKQASRFSGNIHLALGAPLPFLLVSELLKIQIILPLLVIPKLSELLAFDSIVPRHTAARAEQAVTMRALRFPDLHQDIIDQQGRTILERTVQLIITQQILTQRDVPPVKQFRRDDIPAQIHVDHAVLAIGVRASD